MAAAADAILCEPRAFEHVWPLALKPLTGLLTYENDTLNRAVQILHTYLAGEQEWFHITVNLANFARFLKAMDKDGGHSRTLRHSCWCNGGCGSSNPRHLLHRHLVVVAASGGHFVQNVWSKMVSKDMWNMRLEEIQSPLHLVYTMHSLSQFKSRCHFAGKHMHLMEYMPKEYRLILALQWDNGMWDLLERKMANASVDYLKECLVEYVDSKFRIRCRDIPGLPLGYVVPVSREFQPCGHATPYYLHLAGGRKLYFEKNEALHGWLLGDWLEWQAESGNALYSAVGHEYWTFSEPQQIVLHNVKAYTIGEPPTPQQREEYKRMYKYL